MAYIPIKDKGAKLKKYMAAAGVALPDQCVAVTIHWAVAEAAKVTFEVVVLPDDVPDMPIPIEGAMVETVVVARTVIGDGTHSYAVEPKGEESDEH